MRNLHGVTFQKVVPCHFLSNWSAGFTLMKVKSQCSLFRLDRKGNRVFVVGVVEPGDRL